MPNLNKRIYVKVGTSFERRPFEALRKGDIFKEHGNNRLKRVTSNIIGNVPRHAAAKAVRVQRVRYI